MKKRIKNSLGRTTKAAPWLLAMFTAAALAVTSVMPSFQAQNASAADDTPGICVGQDVQIGDLDADLKTPDTGVATYVGRDFYVGSRPAGTNLELTGASDGEIDTGDGKKVTNYTAAPGPSYAAEAEGLTVVRGKFAANKVGNSWAGNGFRIGAVGFGANYRPKNDRVTLAVGGLGSNIATMLPNTANKAEDDVTVGAWTKGSWVGDATGEKDVKGISFTAQIAKGYSYWASDGEKPAVVKNEGAKNADGLTYNAPDALSIDGTDFDKNYSEYLTKLQDDSKNLKQMSGQFTVKEGTAFTNNSTGSDAKAAGIYIGTAPTGSYTRYHYKDGNIKYTFNYDSSNNEKLITFQGDGTSMMQVFQLPASYLTNSGYRGIDFAFSNIPENAAVAVNITGDTNIQFNTGWRFWWNGNEIGDSYTNYEIPDVISKEDKELYNVAAKSIMWNFQDMTAGKLLTINGGWNRKSGDDPAAQMMGSILVPYASFDDHVTTNGRVWVGEDFMMNSPHYYGDFLTANSASSIGMDMERHNYPWIGSASTVCSVLNWNKVNAQGNLLEGSSWGVYTSLTAAADMSTSSSELLYAVTDQGTNDLANGADEGGKLKVGRLNPNATYYLREHTAPSGHVVSPYIFAIKTENTGETANETITAVYDLNQNPVDMEKWSALFTDAGIINEPAGSSISWGKVSSEDTAHTAPLEGSTWMLKGPGAKDGILITDNTTLPTSMIITRDGSQVTEINVNENEHVQLAARVYPEKASQLVTWSATDLDGNPTNLIGVTDSGMVFVNSDLEEPEEVWVMATAKELDKDNQPVTARVKFTIIPVAANSLTLKYQNDTAPAVINGSLGKNIQLNAVTDPENLNVTWESSDPTVATVVNGVVKPLKAGTTTITALCKGLRASVLVKIVNDTITTVYVDSSAMPAGSTPHIRYAKAGTDSWSGMVSMKQYCDNWYSVDVDLAKEGFKFYISPANNQGNNWSGDKSVVKNTQSVIVNSDKTVVSGNDYQPSCSTEGAKETKVYFQANGFTPYIRYNVNGWTDPIEMTKACGNWFEYAVPSNGAGFTFYLMGKNDKSDNISGDKTVAAGTSSVSVDSSYKMSASLAPGCVASTLRDEASEPAVAALALPQAEAFALNGNIMANDAQDPSFEEKIMQAESQNYGVATLEAEQYSDSNGNAGLFTINNLQEGTYELWEQNAPEGYHKNPHHYTITVSKNSDGKLEAQFTGDPIPTKNNGMWWITDDPTKVTWEKVDQDNQPLPGSYWTIQQFVQNANGSGGTWKSLVRTADCVKAPCSTDIKYTDQNSGPGKFAIYNLPANANYRIYESVVPNGYTSDGSWYYFSIPLYTPEGDIALQRGTDADYDGNTGAYQASSQTNSARSVGNTIENTKKRGTVTWIKVGEGSVTPLPGSEWTLEKKNGDNWEAIKEITDCVGDGACSTEAPDSNDEDNKMGQFKVSSLDWGTYRLVETKAPDGYNQLTEPLAEFTFDASTTEWTFTYGNVENTPGVILPETGGEGTTWIVMLGIAFTALAMMGCGLALRRRTV